MGDVSGEAEVNVQSITQTGIDTKGLMELLQAIRWATTSVDERLKEDVEAQLALVDEEIAKDHPSPSKIRAALTKAWDLAKGTGKVVGGWVVEGALRIALEKLKTGGL